MSTEKKLTTTRLAVVLAMMIAISKLLGIIRELFLANYFGASYVTDAYTMSLSIPNNLLSGIVGAAGVAFIPVFSRKVEESGLEDGNRFTSQILNCLSLVTAAVMIICWIFAKPLVSVFAPGFTGETQALTVFYMRVAFVMVLFSVISNILGSYMEYKGNFIPVQVCGYLQNFCIIAVIVLSAKLGNPRLLIFGITIGMFAQATGKFFVARKSGFKYYSTLNFSDSVKEILTLAVPVFIGNSASEINSLIDRVLASGLPEGSVSALNYGMLFTNTVTALSAGVFTTILYPRIAQANAQNDYARVSDLAERGINLISLIIIPCTFGALAFAPQVVQVVYERGAFDEAATALTASAFLFYSLGMLFTSIKTFIDKIFYSFGDAKTPVICSVLAVVLNVVLNLVLVKPMAHAGLALATSISQMVGALTAYYMFRKKHSQIPLLRSKRKLLLIFVFSLISVGIGFGVYSFVGSHIWMPRMVLLLLAVAVAVAVYLLLIYVRKFDEIALVKDLLGIKDKKSENI